MWETSSLSHLPPWLLSLSPAMLSVLLGCLALSQQLQKMLLMLQPTFPMQQIVCQGRILPSHSQADTVRPMPMNLLAAMFPLWNHMNKLWRGQKACLVYKIDIEGLADSSQGNILVECEGRSSKLLHASVQAQLHSPELHAIPCSLQTWQ